MENVLRCCLQERTVFFSEEKTQKTVDCFDFGLSGWSEPMRSATGGDMTFPRQLRFLLAPPRAD
jgi:hypothetical protein